MESLKEYADNSGHHHHHAAALTNLGVIEFAEGRYNEAKALLNEAVRKRRMLVHKDEFQPPNISSLSIALKKDRVFHKAPSAKIEMEAAMLKEHGTVDAMTAEVIGNLAMCCQKTGDLEEAKTLYEECLKLKKVNHQHLKMIFHATRLFVICIILVFHCVYLYNIHRCGTAAMTLRIIQVIYGERSLQVANSLHSIASVLDAMCRPAEAEELLLESLSIEQQVYGEKSPETAVTLNNLGVMCVHNGEYAKALPFLELSHRIRRDAFGEDHHLTQVADKNLTFLRDKISAQGSSP